MAIGMSPVGKLSTSGRRKTLLAKPNQMPLHPRTQTHQKLNLKNLFDYEIIQFDYEIIQFRSLGV